MYCFALPTVRHAEKTLASVLELEVLIGKLLSIDGLAASAIYMVRAKLVRCSGIHSLQSRTMIGKIAYSLVSVTSFVGNPEHV